MIYHRDQRARSYGINWGNFSSRTPFRNNINFSETPCSLCLGGKIISSVPFFSLCALFSLRASFLVAVFFLAVIFEGVLQFAGELGIQLL